MFYVIKLRQLILILLFIISLTAACICSFSAKDPVAVMCRDFLEELGYHPDKKPQETTEVKIPEGFGKVYENYNALQSVAGFDLTPFRGTNLMRYTFRLSDGEYTLANILVHNGKICGGDILNPSLSGKILPLTPREKE